MSKALALVVDDEPDIRELLELTLRRMGVEVCAAADLGEARALLAERPVSLCLTDMRLPDGDGLELVEYIQRSWPEVPVAVITAHGSMDTAIQALKLGAFDFVNKPVDLQVLRDLISAALRLVPASTPAGAGGGLIGESTAIERIRATVAKVARSQAPVYISGESGTGKELVARMIHDRGPRADCPFVPVNCGAIPSELMESEFFGHKRGSFSGATADKEGLFQAAHGGTLFLDEVAELPLLMQVKLLRAIQEKAVRPVGVPREVAIDVRILSATHKDLAALVAEGGFRQDLYYRINVIELKVPPLRERPGDIALLARHLVGRAGAQVGQPGLCLDGGAVAALERYPFPGNVRELENILERAAALCEGAVIHAEDLMLPQDGPAVAVEPPPLEGGEQPLDDYLAEIERNTISRALEQTRWNKTAAAKALGISFRSLRYKLKKLGME
ncbi:sigma-54-dependent transcriptional regulator [Endothiovibrio diazotrophicus]